MTERYIYTDKVGAGPEHPKKQWGLFSKELTTDEAVARYDLDAARREDWFGVVLQSDDQRPHAYLQMCPRANGVEMHKLNAQGGVDVAYTWRAYYTPSDSAHYDGDDSRIFLSAITWYTYPDELRFYLRNASVGNVSMTFGPDGYGKEERVTKRGFGEPAEVETREFRNVDVTANWTRIPDFGDWGAFFHPETQK